ncbi:hypothetical protein HW273_05410 [Oribacterium sp. oral taxon 102]|uniref:hypothetical protein n=1 Tax=Oribacterium sp. oral taxon 102 TaxID=671214 RepID=UPI0015B9D0E1|nr:hypothetical protein [Oribacterium sp. oral taxon 102]NWO21333.1 hypothetical protein [Oribacterium sp. oral taxon 102]
MNKKERIQGVQVIEVVQVKYLRGSGSEKDPVREVIQYWDLSGKLLAERDSTLIEQTTTNMPDDLRSFYERYFL